MLLNLRYLLREHLFNCEYVDLFGDCIDTDVIFTQDIYCDFLLDDTKHYWSVNIDGLHVMYLSVRKRVNS